MTSESHRQLPADLRRSLGLRIVEHRRAQRWSQRELALRTGLRYMRLSKIENGHATPTLAELLRIAETFAVRLDELVHGPRRESAGLEPILRALAGLERFVSAEERALLAKLGRALVAGFAAIPSDPVARRESPDAIR